MNESSPAPDGNVRGFSFALQRRDDGALGLRAAHHPDYGLVVADWCGAELQRRIAGGRRQALARACGLQRKPESHILDATGGLGRDAYTLAALGATVVLCERQPLIAALLQDARQRALASPTQAPAAQRITIHEAEALTLLRSGAHWDAVYLDPMYPEDGKTALPGKEMQLFRELTGGDADADALLDAALRAAPRVAVKRPSKAPWLAAREPAASLPGSQLRFDLYLAP